MSMALFLRAVTPAEAEAMLKDASMVDEIIERFGRFPHRNAILDRESTPAELEFLREPGSSF